MNPFLIDSGSSVAGTGGNSGDAGDIADTANAAETADTSGSIGSGGSGGMIVVVDDDITKIVPTAGCTSGPGPFETVFPGTILTMGTKPDDCADGKCGPWSYEREYIVTLPAGYVWNQPYPLVFQGTGCGGTAAHVLPLQNNVNNTVIRVGLRPPPNDIGHATNPNQGCYDDREGDDSVDWVFYENLYDKLAAQYCFDKNRVFINGRGMFPDEIACKYAGDATRPIRGVMSNQGGLPPDPKHVPTCTGKPLAGMWVNAVENQNFFFADTRAAIDRAMKVNGCTMGTSYDPAALFDPFPVPSLSSYVCRKIRGCPAAYPLVVCPLPGAGCHACSFDNVTLPGFTTFIKLFSTPPLIP